MYYCCLIKIMHVSFGGNQAIHSFSHSFKKLQANCAQIQLHTGKIMMTALQEPGSGAGTRQLNRQEQTVGPVPQQEMAQVAVA